MLKVGAGETFFSPGEVAAGGAGGGGGGEATCITRRLYSISVRYPGDWMRTFMATCIHHEPDGTVQIRRGHELIATVHGNAFVWINDHVIPNPSPPPDPPPSEDGC